MNTSGVTRTLPCFLSAKREIDLYQKRPALKSAAAANPSLTEAWVNDINGIHLTLSKLLHTVLHTYLLTLFSLFSFSNPLPLPLPRGPPLNSPFPPPPPLSSPSTLDARGEETPQHPVHRWESALSLLGQLPHLHTHPNPTTLHHTHSPTLSHSNGLLSSVQVAFYYLKNGTNLHFPPILHTRVLFLTVAKPPFRGPEYSGALPGSKAKSRHVLTKFSLPALKNRLFQLVRKNR